MRPKELLVIHILCILRQKEGTIQRRIGRLLLIGAAIVLRRPHIAHPIGNGGTQPHELMAQRIAARLQICLRESHRTRQIPLPLYGVGVEIAEHILRCAMRHGILRELLRRSILLCPKEGKESLPQSLTVLIDTIVMIIDGL